MSAECLGEITALSGCEMDPNACLGLAPSLEDTETKSVLQDQLTAAQVGQEAERIRG